MKVVLFCGGYGMRMREGADDIPKPMAMVGNRPLIWHVMRYYAHFGHREFILAMGFGAKHIARYFLEYEEAYSNDFVIDRGATNYLTSDVKDWKITFAHTGIDTPIGERLHRVAPYLGDDDLFLANYADVLTDAPLDQMINEFAAGDALATMLAVPPQAAFHIIDVSDGNDVRGIRSVSDLPIRENGGYFVMRREILDELQPGHDLVGDTLSRLSARGFVKAYPYDGFWMPADTVKERTVLETLAATGTAPWRLWDLHEPPHTTAPAPDHILLSGR